MAVIPRQVGVMLPGAPSAGDPLGTKDAHQRHARSQPPQLGSSMAFTLRGQRVNGVAMIQALVVNEFGSRADVFAEDQTRASPMTWHTLQDIDV